MVTRLAMAAIAIAGSVTAALAAETPRPTIVVLPQEGPIDAPFNVNISGLPPGARVLVEAKFADNDSVPWTASGNFVADTSGRLETATSTSLSGTYQGVSAHGLVCSALPIPADQLETYIANFPTNPRQPTTIGYLLERFPITVTASVDGKVFASQVVGRSLAAGTAGEDVVGPSGWRALFFPAAKGMPAGEPVVVISGSGGGVFDDTAALLASHGHPALALALYRYEGLPDALHNFPIETIRDAGRWLSARSGSRKVALFGVSRGSEAVQLAAINFSDAFSSVIALAPSHLAGSALGPGTTIADAAWSVGGKPIAPFEASPFDLKRAAETGKVAPGNIGAEQYLDLWNDPTVEARFGFNYENLQVPILLIGAEADDVWPSAISVERIRRRLAAAGKSRLVEAHTYQGVGHGFVFPGRGSAISNFGYIPVLGGFSSLGGLPNANCEASIDHIAVVLAFLRRVRS